MDAFKPKESLSALLLPDILTTSAEGCLLELSRTEQAQLWSDKDILQKPAQNLPAPLWTQYKCYRGPQRLIHYNKAIKCRDHLKDKKAASNNQLRKTSWWISAISFKFTVTQGRMVGLPNGVRSVRGRLALLNKLFLKHWSPLPTLSFFRRSFAIWPYF